jgi:hypothetical protein
VTLAGHLAALLVLSAHAGAFAPAPPAVVSVALDLTALDEEAYRRVGGLALEKQVVLRLVQESFAVVAPAANPDVRLRVEEAGPGLRLSASSRAGAETREVALAPEEPLQELHLEVSQKLVELARAVAPPPLPEPAKPEPARPVPPRWWSVEAAAGAEALVRKGGVDAQARLALRWGGRLGVRLAGALSPSRTSEIRVLEWTILAGPAFHHALAPTMDLEVDLLGGLLVHHFTILDAYSHDHAGDRFDWVLSLPLALTLRPLPFLSLSLRIAGRVDGHGREHVLGEQVLWSREGFGFEAGGTVGAKF